MKHTIHYTHVHVHTCIGGRERLLCTCHIWCYFAIIGSRIYQFIGMAGRSDVPIFGDLFAHYDNIKGDCMLSYVMT